MKNYLIPIICIALIWAACNQSAKKQEPMEAIEQMKGIVLPDTFAKPKVTLITAANAPLQFPVPKPNIIPLQYPYGVGKPSITTIGVPEGLSANNATCMATDRLGNLWIGGFGFLSKYDGTKFTNYSGANGLGKCLISSLLVDSKQNVWIGTFDDGLSKYNGSSFQLIPRADKEKTLSVVSMLEDREGTIWLISDSDHLYRVEGDSLKVYSKNEELKNSRVWDIVQDKTGRLLVSTNKGVMTLQGDSLTPFLGIPTYDNHNQHARLVDKQGNIWLTPRISATEVWLGKFDGKTITYFSEKDGFITGGGVPVLFMDDNGILWISTIKGLYRFDGSNFILYSEEDGLPSIYVTSITQDASGNIWVSTYNGIARLSYAYINKLEVPFTAKTQFNSLLAIGGDGAKWVALRESNKLIRYEKDKCFAYDLGSIGIKEWTIREFISDHMGRLWLGVNDKQLSKLICFDKRVVTVYENKQGMTLSAIYGIRENKEGAIFITGEGGVLVFNDNSFIEYGVEGLNTVLTILQDSKGRIWMGTENDGVLMMEGSIITKYNQGTGLLGNTINDITEDPFGNIWVTNAGVAKISDTGFANFGVAEGMDELILGVSVDTLHKVLWISSIRGLIEFPFDQFNNTRPELHRYSQHNGFESINGHLQYGKKYYDSFGIWGISDEIYRFDYDQVKKIPSPILQLTKLRVDNQEVLWTGLKSITEEGVDSLALLNEAVLKFKKPLDTQIMQKQLAAFVDLSFDSLQRDNFIPLNLKLPYKNNSITFEFSSISPSFGKYTQYRYWLEGYEKYWSPLSEKNEAYFGNMSEGKYTFHLVAVYSNGKQSDLKYYFNVLPPWYRTWWAYSLYALVFLSGIFLFIRWRTKALQIEKTILEEKVTTRTAELKESLENLKSTQSQLIQSEKMASLGELTAGIAHEIQNPLNFVNNFSEVSNELIKEIQDIRHKTQDQGNKTEEDEILNDIAGNLEKINHHGKRAADIVKGMLQHSRSSSGVKEPTDINALADEYLRLAYHGLRAKDKSFNATMKTDFDESIGNINVIPQDIGRVILNLITNAFYVVNEKKTLRQAEGDNSYEPTVSVSTKKDGKKVLISVRDNGNGIPDKIKEKIFQPFFTTKPAGQGTGLGLSLSYDIVTKGHSGSLTVESQEGVGSTFILVLPVQ